eukprot:6609043-Pyramimonas_sp.AAC.1
MNEEFLRDIRAADGRDAAVLHSGPRGHGAQASVASEPLSQASMLLAIIQLDEDVNASDSSQRRARAGPRLQGGRQSEKKEAWNCMKDLASWKPVVRQWGRKVPFYFPALCASADLS